VLTFAGDRACGDIVEKEISTVASDVRSVIIKDCGHYPAEERPGQLLEALLSFLEPYSQGADDGKA
jgi:pimeloyl-ACP methyl ester carboxylesterase